LSLSKKTISGVIWNFSETLARRGVGILVTLILAKLLAPVDFGLIALMSVFLALATSLMESGFRLALIRIPDITERHYNTGFYSNIALGLISYSLVFIFAPLIADYYQEPRLTFLIRLISIAVIFDSFQVVQRAALSRAINFKVQMKAALPAGIISGVVAVTIAYFGGGVYALVFQVLVNSLALTIFLWMFQKWRPALIFDWALFKEMYAFGYKIFLSRTLDKLFNNIYVIVIAKVFSAQVLGLYFFAHQIKTLIVVQLVNSIQAVTFPALSSLQSDEEQLKAGYRRVISITSFILFPMMVLIGVLAPFGFEILFDSKWAPAAYYLQLLCVVGLLFPLHALNLNIIKVKGRSDLYLKVTIYKKIITVVILFFSLPFGIEGVLLGQIGNSIISYYLNAQFSGKLINYSIPEQIKDIYPILGIALLSGSIGYICTVFIKAPSVVLILISGSLMVFFYSLLSYYFKMDGFLFIQNQLYKKIIKKRDEYKTN